MLSVTRLFLCQVSSSRKMTAPSILPLTLSRPPGLRSTIQSCSPLRPFLQQVPNSTRPDSLQTKTKSNSFCGPFRKHRDAEDMALVVTESRQLQLKNLHYNSIEAVTTQIYVGNSQMKIPDVAVSCHTDWPEFLEHSLHCENEIKNNALYILNAVKAVFVQMILLSGVLWEGTRFSSINIKLQHIETDQYCKNSTV